MGSTRQVFALPELLENILQNLPIRDLLLSQRVCQIFRNVIKRSPRLQRKLFFRADIYQEGDVLRELEWNPLLDFLRSQRLLFPDRRKLALHFAWRKWLLVHPNNLLDFEDFVLFPGPRTSSIRTNKGQMNACVPQFNYPALEKANYPTASWRTMHFMQPAVGTMTLDSDVVWKEKDGIRRQTKSYLGPDNSIISHYRTLNGIWTWVSKLKRYDLTASY